MKLNKNSSGNSHYIQVKRIENKAFLTFANLYKKLKTIPRELKTILCIVVYQNYIEGLYLLQECIYPLLWSNSGVDREGRDNVCLINLNFPKI